MIIGIDGVDLYTNAVAVFKGALLPALIGLSVLIFSWGILKYLWAWEHELERERGKKLMLFAVTAQFVLLIVYAVVVFATGQINRFTGIEDMHTSTLEPLATTSDSVIE